MALGRAKMRSWKAWEKETQSLEYQIAHDSKRFRYTRETSFARRHVNFWTESSFLLWIAVLYFGGKSGLFHTPPWLHISSLPQFQKFQFSEIYTAVSGERFQDCAQNQAVLAVGTKLHHVVAKMALRLDKDSAVITGAPLVQPSDELFWFGNPKFVLSLFHLILFQNAFEFTFFVWIWYEFGLRSCYHEKLEVTITRVVLAVVVQFLCSYITLPLYALVTQMGSEFKWPARCDGQTASAIRQWHEDVRKRMQQQQQQQHSSEDATFVSGAGNS